MSQDFAHHGVAPTGTTAHGHVPVASTEATVPGPLNVPATASTWPTKRRRMSNPEVDFDKRRNKLGYQRASIACGHCRRRKIRCPVAEGDPQQRCQNCIRLKKECVFYPTYQQSVVESGRSPSSRPAIDLGSSSRLLPLPPEPGPTRSFESPQEFGGFQTVPWNRPQEGGVVFLEPGSEFGPGHGDFTPFPSVSASHERSLPSGHRPYSYLNQTNEPDWKAPLRSMSFNDMSSHLGDFPPQGVMADIDPRQRSLDMFDPPASKGSLQLLSATPSHIVAQKAAPSQQQPWNGPNTTIRANAPSIGQFANQVSPVLSRSSHTLSASHSTFSPDGVQTWQSYSYVPRPELVRPIDWQPPVSTTAPLPFDAFQTPSEASKALDHATPIYQFGIPPAEDQKYQGHPSTSHKEPQGPVASGRSRPLEQLDEELYHGSEPGAPKSEIGALPLLEDRDAHKDTSETEHRFPAANQSTRLSPVDDFEALRDPAKYYRDLDTLETRVADLCCISRLFQPNLHESLVSDTQSSQETCTPSVTSEVNVIDASSVAIQTEPSATKDSSMMTITSFPRRISKTTGYFHAEPAHSSSSLRAQCLLVLQGILSALDLLRKEGFCGDEYNVLCAVKERPGVIETVPIAREQIEALKRLLQFPEILPSGFSAFVARLYLSLHMRPPLSSTSGQVYDNFDFFAMDVPALISMLALALVSYTGAHCASLELRCFDGFDPTSDLLVIHGQDLDHDIIQEPRRLACLDGFISGPVRVFRETERSSLNCVEPAGPSCLLTRLNQFADLWGPIWVVPAEDTHLILSAHTQHGMIFQSENKPDTHCVSQSNKLRDHAHPGEINCHWVPLRLGSALDPSDETGTGHGYPQNCHFELLESRSHPLEFTPFAADAQLLIGAPVDGRETTTMVVEQCGPEPEREESVGVTYTRAFQPEQKSNEEQSSQSTPPRLRRGLRLSRRCAFEPQAFLKQNTGLLHMCGTKDAYYLPDSYQISFSAGKYLNPSASKTYKRHPGSTYKDRIMDYCYKPHANLGALLRLRVGLEISACTMNARRVTLWHALKVAYSGRRAVIGTNDNRLCSHDIGDLACMSECWAALPAFLRDSIKKATDGQDGLRTAIPPLMAELQQSGVSLAAALVVWVPFTSIPHTLTWQKDMSLWAHMLRDCRHVATFATLTERCLVYEGKDIVAERSVLRACAQRTAARSKPLLQTIINLDASSSEEISRLRPEISKVDAGEYRDSGNKSCDDFLIRRVGSYTVLPAGARVRLVAGGTLEIRHSRPIQLAQYERDSVVQKGKEALICIRNGDWGHTHRELVDPELATDSILPICIM